MKTTALVQEVLPKQKQESLFSNMIVFPWDKLTSLILMLLPHHKALHNKQRFNNKLLMM